MREKTLKILCVCQVGVGSSVMLRVFVGKALDAMGVKDYNIVMLRRLVGRPDSAT